jgi:hypothetical protein
MPRHEQDKEQDSPDTGQVMNASMAHEDGALRLQADSEITLATTNGLSAPSKSRNENRVLVVPLKNRCRIVDKEARPSFA